MIIMTSIILLIVYLLGVAATIVDIYRHLNKGETVTVSELIIGLIVSAFSWIGLIVFYVVVYGDTVIFTKK